MPDKPSEQTQSDRFKAVARELGADESEDAFDATLRKVGARKPPPQTKNPPKGRVKPAVTRKG